MLDFNVNSVPKCTFWESYASFSLRSRQLKVWVKRLFSESWLNTLFWTGLHCYACGGTNDEKCEKHPEKCGTVSCPVEKNYCYTMRTEETDQETGETSKKRSFLKIVSWAWFFFGLFQKWLWTDLAAWSTRSVQLVHPEKTSKRSRLRLTPSTWRGARQSFAMTLLETRTTGEETTVGTATKWLFLGAQELRFINYHWLLLYCYLYFLLCNKNIRFDFDDALKIGDVRIQTFDLNNN